MVWKKNNMKNWLIDYYNRETDFSTGSSEPRVNEEPTLLVHCLH